MILLEIVLKFVENELDFLWKFEQHHLKQKFLEKLGSPEQD